VTATVLNVVKAIISLSAAERLHLLTILRADLPELWRKAERAFVADRLATITAPRRKPPDF
jgi:hypothetical protein